MTPLPRTPDAPLPEGRIVRTVEPINDECDLARVPTLITPNDAFYIRCHGPIPRIDDGWRLSVEGLVQQPLTLSLADLRALPWREIVLTLECAGNRRTLQRPIPPGVPWQTGAVSTARFAGVPLAAVLQLAGVRAEARHIRMEGADRCPTDEGVTPFARSIPIDLALQETTLLALEMNGVPLPPEHGAPLRVVLPGFYAMNAVKWLARLTAHAEPEPGHFQTRDYLLWHGEGDAGDEIGPMRVMAAIASPAAGSRIAAGRVLIRGMAWTGTGVVARVDVSTDGGRSWQEARLTSAAVPGVWRLWEHEWVATPGTHTLLARATDTAGHIQPATVPPNRKGYANNAIVPVTVDVDD